MSFVFLIRHNNIPKLAHISLCITEFMGRTMSLHVSAHGAILKLYINKPYTTELTTPMWIHILHGVLVSPSLITFICTDWVLVFLYCFKNVGHYLLRQQPQIHLKDGVSFQGTKSNCNNFLVIYVTPSWRPKGQWWFTEFDSTVQGLSSARVVMEPKHKVVHV
jgi:hypothetical protein